MLLRGRLSPVTFTYAEELGYEYSQSYFQVRHWNSSQIRSSAKDPDTITTCPSNTSCASVMALLMCSNVRLDASKASCHASKERCVQVCKVRKIFCKSSACITAA